MRSTVERLLLCLSLAIKDADGFCLILSFAMKVTNGSELILSTAIKGADC